MLYCATTIALLAATTDFTNVDLFSYLNIFLLYSNIAGVLFIMFDVFSHFVWVLGFHQYISLIEQGVTMTEE